MVTINKKFNFNRVKEDYYRLDLGFFYFDDDAVYYTESHYMIRIYYVDFFKSDCDIDTSMLVGKKLSIQAIKILQKNKFKISNGEFIINDNVKITPQDDVNDFLTKIKKVLYNDNREKFETSIVSFPKIKEVLSICSRLKYFQMHFFDNGRTAIINFLDSCLIEKVSILIMGEIISDSDNLNEVL